MNSADALEIDVDMVNKCEQQVLANVHFCE